MPSDFIGKKKFLDLYLRTCEIDYFIVIKTSFKVFSSSLGVQWQTETNKFMKCVMMINADCLEHLGKRSILNSVFQIQISKQKQKTQDELFHFQKNMTCLGLRLLIRGTSTWNRSVHLIKKFKDIKTLCFCENKIIVYVISRVFCLELWNFYFWVNNT